MATLIKARGPSGSIAPACKGLAPPVDRGGRCLFGEGTTVGCSSTPLAARTEAVTSSRGLAMPLGLGLNEPRLPGPFIGVRNLEAQTRRVRQCSLGQTSGLPHHGAGPQSRGSIVLHDTSASLDGKGRPTTHGTLRYLLNVTMPPGQQ